MDITKITEYIRNACIYVAIIKIKYGDDKNELVNNYKIVGTYVGKVNLITYYLLYLIVFYCI